MDVLTIRVNAERNGHIDSFTIEVEIEELREYIKEKHLKEGETVTDLYLEMVS